MRIKIMGFVVALVLLSMCSVQVQATAQYFILKGDLHVHSDFSHDSTVPVETVLRESIMAGYDFISLTEHNTTRHMLEDYSSDDLLVIAGYEYTISSVHINVFGLRHIPRNTSIFNLKELDAYLQQLRNLGGYLQINHPNDPTYYSRFGYDMDLDFIEILNGVWKTDDHQTLLDWQKMLVEGRKLVATGGSDAHGNHTTRGAFNNVYVTERSEEAILEALLAGRNFVTVQADGPVITMMVDDEIMGGTVQYRDNQTIKVAINNIAPQTIVKLYSNRGLELNDTFSGNSNGIYLVEMPTASKEFIRVELWFNENQICAYSNPIFITQSEGY